MVNIDQEFIFVRWHGRWGRGPSLSLGTYLGVSNELSFQSLAFGAWIVKWSGEECCASG